MKVLKEKKWSVTVTCSGAGNGVSGCGSTLEIEKSDIRYYAGKSGDPSVDGTFFYAPAAAVIRCPVCGALTDLSKEKRPVDWKSCEKYTWAWGNADV